MSEEGFFMANHPESGKAVGQVIIENERVRVTRWDFAEKGAATGWHRHEHDYVIVPLSEGRLVIEHAGGTDISELTQGGCYFRPSGVEHDVQNGNDFPYSFVEIELLQPADQGVTGG
jgi:quercetin dioxygenase-like cupin family protein